MAEENRNHKPNAMDVYSFLWRGRDIELTHIWQRSIFLAVFLIGIASLYSLYFKDVFLEQFKTNNSFKLEYYQIFVFGFVPIIITAIGVIFSELWIMMAKGSKVWYSIYDDSIAKVSAIDNFWDHKSIREVYKERVTKEFIFGRLLLKDTTERSESLLSPIGGAFSVSKVNIMIGIVFLIIFGFLFVGHVFWATYLLINISNNLTRLGQACLFIIAAIIISIFFLACCVVHRKALSAYFD
jgi:hypothetical protein